MIESSFETQSRHYAVVARAIEFIRTNARSQPSLADIADEVHLSEQRLQRLFSAWAGISPKRFLQYLTKEHARQALSQSADILSTALESGLSGPGRLHDLMVSCEAMTPGEIKALGEGVSVGHGVAPTPFGNALIGWTRRGICYLAFCDGEEEARQRELSSQWPRAHLSSNAAEALRLARRIFPVRPEPGKLHLLLRGTNFQVKVWEALIKVGSSQLISYSQLAGIIDSPHAQRAVGSALAANRIGYLIPCHRVIRESGESGVYRWGESRKLAIHAWEAGRHNAM
ncbi:MAG: methylated-DNA--[protein]-cysteine S-methyltransferase [Chromatiaceae bacterium]|nr:methylated-DNA--[protein]-cysteine S-methyltransferase [Chromatiaceae bacterium]MCP5408401.1 methylated-DNA--[protein]-cysteine S-methyltransferase [Chromatiaceae bacterium]MCP5444952.1 methylated-DNA--[protein]-cysteine S-methyltransferase [Chromatiaceae bacterium]